MKNLYIANWREDAFLHAKKYGLGVEVQDFTVFEFVDDHVNYANKLKKDLEEINLCSIHGPFSEMVPASWDHRIVEVVRDRFDKAYNACRLLGAKHLILHTGFIPNTFADKYWLENSIRFWQSYMTDKKDDIEIHLENVFENDYGLISELLDTVNNPNLSACLDIGHVNVCSKRSLKDWISGLGDRIRYVHMHNNEGIKDDHFGLWHGTINMPETLKFLEAYSPNASWTIETVAEDAETSIHWLNKMNFRKHG